MALLNRLRGLRKAHVLGINQRNRDLIFRYNPRKLFPLVDDKLRTKTLAAKHGVPTPPLYGVLEIQHDVRNLPSIVEDHPDFAMKPAHGAGGDGILVITNQRNKKFRKANGLWIGYDDVAYHASNIVSGAYSLGGARDFAMIEYRVLFSPLFEKISYEGVPDVRILVVLGYPVMAMVRLPTRQSEGRGNLHQGAIGVGVDLASGVTLAGVWGNETIDEHPDTGHRVAGLQLPEWESFLALAARCYEMTGLGFLGVDIVLDRDRGPLLLELNARPGLNIQIANGAGLTDRCERVEKEAARAGRDANDRVRFSKQAFAATGPAVLPLEEPASR
ncbi:MAG: alpha-L-glutamate ligase-like protein [Candidatus Binatia bacterium]|nr:alpha-L-glutamate ligase-like protein [Candidatus Binatia bacterium]